MEKSKRKFWSIDTVRSFISDSSDCNLVSTQYKSTKQKLLIRCRCGDIYETTFEKFKDRDKRQCNKCSGISNWNIESVGKYINSHEGNGCTLLSKEYKNMYTPLQIKCSCGVEYTTDFTSFKNANSKQCPDCGRNKSVNSRRLKYEDVKYLIENSGSNCTLLSEKYINNSTPLKIKCSCGNTFKTTLANFEYQNTQKCGICTGKMNWDYELVSKYVYDNTDCKLVTKDYENIDTLMDFECRCGKMFTTTFSSFRHSGKTTCDDCSKIMSKSEFAIMKYSIESDINFIPEYRFNDCRNQLPLPFDFAVFDEEDNIKLLIEADGQGHYRPVNFGGISDEIATKRYNKTKTNDSIKDKYCEDNNIPLLRIPYWEFCNIEEILSSVLP